MNKYKEDIYNLSKKIAMKKLTGNIGHVVEEKDKLICYVEKRKCGGYFEFFYTIFCNGINSFNEELANQYDLNKPIYYVIDGIDFGRHPINVCGNDNVNVIIRNCKFNYGLCVSVDGDCLIENSKISEIFERLMIGAYNITIKNMYIYNEYKYTNSLDINIKADYELNIINSNIGRQNERTNVSLVGGDRLILDNSDIRGDKVNCKTEKIINYHSSTLMAGEEVKLDVNGFDFLKVKAPRVILNGNKINRDGEMCVLKQLNDQLFLERVELIKVLRLIKDECEMINFEDVSRYQEELDNRNICKTLNRK